MNYKRLFACDANYEQIIDLNRLKWKKKFSNNRFFRFPSFLSFWLIIDTVLIWDYWISLTVVLYFLLLGGACFVAVMKLSMRKFSRIQREIVMITNIEQKQFFRLWLDWNQKKKINSHLGVIIGFLEFRCLSHLLIYL